jgi:hypothetical protein
VSRYCDSDGGWDDDAAVLAYGRWQNNARRVFKSKRGRQALAEIRDALLALPEPRLIANALCTAADVDTVLPVITDEQIAREVASSRAWYAEHGWDWRPGYAAERGAAMREEREKERRQYTETAAAQGAGVCLVGAYLWHRKIRDGLDPASAFGSLPVILDDESDSLEETAHLGQDAGLAYTLAWELGFRNDEIYKRMTPEERYTAYLAWIEQKLAAGQPA